MIMEKSKISNKRFENEAFSSTSIEVLYNLAHTLVETDSYYLPDELRSNFQYAKRELLEYIEEATGKIRYLRNYRKNIESNEDNC